MAIVGPRLGSQVPTLVDRNHNGTISRAEFLHNGKPDIIENIAYDREFRAKDINNNGRITRDEYVTGTFAQKVAKAVDFKEMDLDRDGSVSKNEYRLWRRFGGALAKMWDLNRVMGKA